MKRILLLSLMFTFLISSLSLEAQNKKTQKVATTVSNKIEVYYFHYTTFKVHMSTLQVFLVISRKYSRFNFNQPHRSKLWKIDV